MNAISDPDSLDNLLAGFFHGQLPHPWPAAPAVASATLRTPRIRDHGARARLTLAASVALFVGLCWSVSNGSNSTHSSRLHPSDGRAEPAMLPSSSAGSAKGDILDEMKAIKAKQPPIDDPFGK